MAAPWCSRARGSIRWRRCRPWPRSAAPRCMACPPCSLRELDHPEFARFDLLALRTGIMAGAPCPIEVMRRCMEVMHLREITIAYGMTETSPVSFQTTPDDPIERRVSTVGRVQPHLEVKIVDVEGRVVPRGHAGRIVHARLFGDAGLLGRCGTHRAGDRPGRLDAHRRFGHHRCRGVLRHCRADQGHGDPRRGERVSARGRGVPVPPSEDRRRAGVRRARRASSARSCAPGCGCARARA